MVYEGVLNNVHDRWLFEAIHAIVSKIEVDSLHLLEREYCPLNYARVTCIAMFIMD